MVVCVAIAISIAVGDGDGLFVGREVTCRVVEIDVGVDVEVGVLVIVYFDGASVVGPSVVGLGVEEIVGEGVADGGCVDTDVGDCVGSADVGGVVGVTVGATVVVVVVVVDEVGGSVVEENGAGIDELIEQWPVQSNASTFWSSPITFNNLQASGVWQSRLERVVPAILNRVTWHARSERHERCMSVAPLASMVASLHAFSSSHVMMHGYPDLHVKVMSDPLQ